MVQATLEDGQSRVWRFLRLDGKRQAIKERELMHTLERRTGKEMKDRIRIRACACTGRAPARMQGQKNKLGGVEPVQ